MKNTSFKIKNPNTDPLFPKKKKKKKQDSISPKKDARLFLEDFMVVAIFRLRVILISLRSAFYNDKGKDSNFKAKI